MNTFEWFVGVGVVFIAFYLTVIGDLLGKIVESSARAERPIEVDGTDKVLDTLWRIETKLDDLEARLWEVQDLQRKK